MIEASKAKAGTRLAADGVITAELQRIDQRIKSAMAAGFYAIEYRIEHVDWHFHNKLKEHVESFGYKCSIESGDQREPLPIHLSISWNQA